MSITAATLTNLAPPDVVKNVSYDAVLKAMRDRAVALYPDFAGFIDLETEPARIILEAAAYEATVLLARVNDAARANLLAFAKGTDLDQLAAFYDVTRMAGEGDERFRLRVVLEIAGRSPAGTEERYRAKAMAASVDVRDAIVWSDGVTPAVHVAVLSTAPDGVASPQLLEIVEDALNDEGVRMVNDQIEVQSAVVGVVNITADVWLVPGTPRKVFENLPDDLQEAWVAEGGIGRDLVRTWIIARLMPPGVYKVDLITPAADRVAGPYEALSIGDINLTLKGRDE